MKTSVSVICYKYKILANGEYPIMLRVAKDGKRTMRIKAPILQSQKGTVYSIQRINVMLKEVKKKYRLNVGNFSCHSLRKTSRRDR